MKKMYVVKYEKNGDMKTAKFMSRDCAKNFALRRLGESDYPVVWVSTCEGMKTLHTETYRK